MQKGKALPFFILPLLGNSGMVFAQTHEQLDTIEVTEKAAKLAGSAVGTHQNISDNVIEQKKLQTRSATLGNALAGELGVHSNPFGGGASAPIIRGQEGVRVKILQNGSDAIDMSTLSPDHAVVVDTLLAEQVELVRGASTLLYATASPAGVVNVVDQRIPTEIPQKGYQGKISTRFDSSSKEKLAVAGVTLALGQHIALRLEGLQRHSNNYHVPALKLNQVLNYVPDTYNRSKVGTIGLSFIGERGYLGIAYSKRQDQYGLPGHNHKFDGCIGHLIDNTQSSFAKNRYYLEPYPHLLDDNDIIEAPHFHCGSSYDLDHDHSHDNPFGHQHDHTHKGPWVDLVSERVDLRGELKKPFSGFDNLKLTLAYADYYHDEKDAGKSGEPLYLQRIDPKANYGKPNALFSNKGFNARLELVHTPIYNFSGLFGMQYQQQKSSAKIPTHFAREISARNPLIENTNKQLSFFAVERYNWQDFLFEVAARYEKQRIPIQYDPSLLKNYRDRVSNPEEPDLSTYEQNAFSYSAATEWYFSANDRIALTFSHNERVPTPMELYYHGKHLATNSFEFGNKNLRKEKSNNIELSLSHESDRLEYKFSAYYNRFKNYIHNENLYRSGNLFMRRYNQSKADFYGFEGEIGYRITPEHKFTLFGDYVRGKLKDLGTIYGDKIYTEVPCADPDEIECYAETGIEQIHKPDRNAARVPPARLGVRWNAEFNENWSAFAEYIYVFGQNKTSTAIYGRRPKKDYWEEEKPPLMEFKVPESASDAYQMLNLGLSYSNHIEALDYKISLNANNLLNEKVYIHNSYLPYVPQMGRNFILGLEASF